MSNPLCPNCETAGRFLEESSRYAWVEYYRCDPCGHVWHYAKGDLTARAMSNVELERSVIPRAAA